MKTVLEVNQTKVPIVMIDKSLDKYDNVVLFPEKLAAANAAIENTNLKDLIEKKQSGQH